MPKQLVSAAIESPGFFGLNKQNSGGILPSGWASEATNFVYDNQGRLASRKGYRNNFTSNPTGTPKAIHEYIDGLGNSITIFATDNAIYKDDGDGTFTDISGTITTPTGDNWQFHNFNGRCVGFQAGHNPVELLSTAGTFADISLSGTQQPSTLTNSGVAAFGRVWALDGTDLKYSDTLDQTAWNGVFDLSLYWRTGMDEAVAVTEYNGYLVVFGKDNIIVYQNPYDPTSSMQIVENIGGIGCIERDTIQDIGTDLLFLSRTGVRSLGRTIQEKSMPIRDVSRNVKDYLISTYNSEASPVKSVYNPEDGFYALSFPSNEKTLVFDIKMPLEDGTLRVTEWDIGPSAFEYTLSSKLYMGFSSRVSYYDGYKDDQNRDATGGNTYLISWIGGWYGFGQEASSFVKIPKKLSILVGGVATVTVSAKWAYDYRDAFYKSDITFDGVTVSRYGTAQYSIDTYSGSLSFSKAKTPLQSSGQVIKFGMESVVDGYKVILQRLDMLAKIGRYSL